MEELTQAKLAFLRRVIPGNAAIYSWQGECLKTLYMAEGLPQLNGVSLEEYQKMTQENALALVFPEDWALLREKMEYCVGTGQSIEHLYRVWHKTHGFDWVHVHARLAGTYDGYPVLIASFANASEETGLYQTLLDASQRKIYVIDRRNYELLYVNK